MQCDHRNRAPKSLDFINKLLDLFDRFIKGLDHIYRGMLVWAMGHKKRTILVTVGIFIASLCLIPVIGMEFMPASDEGTRQITSSLEEQKKQVSLRMDKEKIRQYGLTGSQVASQVKNMISGYTAATLKANELS